MIADVLRWLYSTGSHTSKKQVPSTSPNTANRAPQLDTFGPQSAGDFDGKLSNHSNLGAIPPLIPEATNKAFESPPEACSLRFNEQGQVVEYTAGYVIDRRQGNTGGRGGLLGPLYAIGKGFPFPEAQPYEWSWQRKLFTWLGELLAGAGPK
ncbi:unnamed protein product [Durusdinium trenchii]|uniref:Uncharacterized protein n=1 Tax=Durusdinium trenchii TaxID=1381693 RepID=A0ABP0MHJ3_9DINO